MFAFPLYYLALPFLLALAVWLVFTLLSLWYVSKYGYINYGSFVVTVLFLGASIITLAISINLLSSVEWGYQIGIQNTIY